jgi:hypothetical protein
VLQVTGQASLLVVDQLEELFTLCTDDGKRRAFLNRLLGLPGPTRVVLTMREDFREECGGYPELVNLLDTHAVRIEPMDAAELRQAMENQAAKVGLRFEPGLSNTILDDLQGEPGTMPLLQHTLLELWNHRRGRWLRAEEYQKIGGVKKAIANTAAAVYRDLSDDDKVRVRGIFERLTRLDDEAREADGRRDTRQRVNLDELTPAGSDPAQTKALLERLADARLIVTTANATTKVEEVEVAHEALIRSWPRLREWLDQDRTDLRVLASVRSAARDWEKNRADESLLSHHGARLLVAERLRTHPRLGMNQGEVDYLDACRKRQERQAERERRYRSWIVRVSLAGTVIALGLAGLAWYQRNRAVEAHVETQITWANGLFRPLGLQSGGLNQVELSALTELGSLPEPQAQVRVRFVKRALDDPESARRFATRFPVVLQAAVGLNKRVAAQVDEILREKLRDSDDSTRITAALAILELDLADNAARQLAGGDLVGEAERGNQIVPVATLASSIVQGTRGLPGDQAATFVAGAAKALAEALSKESASSAQAALARVLAEVCQRLPPEAAAKLLADALAKASDSEARAALAGGLAEVCQGLPADRARTHLEPAAKLLADALAKASYNSDREALARALAEVCQGLPDYRARTQLEDAA